MTSQHKLHELSLRYGIEPFYWDVHGVRHEATDEAKRLLLETMGVETGDDGAIDRAILQHERQKWSELLPPAFSRFEGQPLTIPIRVTAELKSTRLSWRFEGEQGSSASGELDLNAVDISDRASVDGVEYVLLEPQIDIPTEPGYHRIVVALGNLNAETRLILSPARCYLPEGLRGEQREWGIALQLYSLRSERNWGIGDLGDLMRSAREIATNHAHVVGLNPLHALFERDTDNVSPYSPNSRLARNVSIIDIEAVPEFHHSAEIRQFVSHARFQERLRAARATALVEYGEMWSLKFEVFERLYAALEEGDPNRRDSFERFVSEASNGLRAYATYNALREMFAAKDPQLWGWPVWPAEYQNWQSPAVKQFAEDEAHRVRFYLYLQFLAEEQLGAVERTLKDAGVDIGLYLDLALGSNSGGAETWMNRELYAFEASAGAPPDELGPNGQDWGLPPIVPYRLRQQQYEAFIAVVRFNMRHAGALRIDHVMSLFRLFWIARGSRAADGAYVRYPFEDLLAIVTLESNRQKTLVIGEDLGTVPDEVRAGMQRTGILSYKVLYFAKSATGIIPSAEFPRHALVVTGTHDLPTLTSYWSAEDVELRKSLSLFSAPELYDLMLSMRLQDRTNLLARLKEEHLYQADDPTTVLQADADLKLSLAFHAYLARTPSMLQMLQLEDVLGLTDQVNVPGTVNEHPNWRRKLPQTLTQILVSPQMKLFRDTLERERNQGPGEPTPGSG
ncbi:MAG: 4-alpha-glucanotransferase [Bdellovibrionota bacterium]